MSVWILNKRQKTKNSINKNTYKTLATRLRYFSVLQICLAYNYGTKEIKDTEVFNMKDQTIAVNKIKDSYCEKPVTKLDELKSLDKQRQKTG